MSKENLRRAEKIALNLFDEIEKQGLIKAGKTEEQLNNEVYKLSHDLLGTKKHWHKRIVRSGKNTLLPYQEDPPNLIIQDNDILFFDFGPILENWEADLGRTYVLGNDALKLKLKSDTESCWYAAKKRFENRKNCTGAELFNFVIELAESHGWEFGGEIAGHIIGEFPHEKLDPKTYDLYVHPQNNLDMKKEIRGKKREWILEIHLVDRQKKIGGFFEQLLT
ncbi:M24 family metallopeptidase [Ekhidna sp. To15]|uniref:M24 family metallopeptidase n=1 Tax=Ekhidna sp. To15 TaxID=3395267 RepID=UPI003F525ECB